MFLTGVVLSYRSRVDGETVILVVHGGTVNVDVGARADIEGVGVVALCGTSGVIDGNISDVQVVRLDAEALDGGVVDLEAGDGRGVQLVGVEELGLCLSTIATLAIPPAGSVSVNLGTGCLLDFDVGSGHGDERTLPLLVAESGLTREDDLDMT